MSNQQRSDSSEGGIELLEKPNQKLKRPSMFTVFVHNDPFTPREFVVHVLLLFFKKTMEQSVEIMMKAHTEGMAPVGNYTKEIAETKADQANKYCRGEGRPLHFSVQEDSSDE